MAFSAAPPLEGHVVDDDGAASRTDASGTFSVGTWNIRDGRGGGLEAACRALEAANIDVCVLQETKISNGIHTRYSSGYYVACSVAPNPHQGGVALCYRDHAGYELEEHKFYGPNVLSFRLIVGKIKFYCIGCYIAPTDDREETLDFCREAVAQLPAGFELLLMGDFNINLDTPRDTREDIIAEQCDDWDLTCLSTHFLQRRTRQLKGRWTWRQERLGRWVSTKPDYFLARVESRKRIRNVKLRRLRHHSTDHRAIIATIWSGRREWMSSYRRKVGRNPLLSQLVRPLSEAEEIVERLRATIPKQTRQERHQNSWISSDTWDLVDRRARLRRYGSLQGNGYALTRQINASFRRDRERRAEKAAEDIEYWLNSPELPGNLKECWNIARGWYRSASDRAAKPCYLSMVEQTDERRELYEERASDGDHIPINVDAFDIRDGTPTDEELRRIVRERLKRGRAGGASQIRAEHILEWLDGVELEESDDYQGPDGPGDSWRLFVELIQVIWDTGRIPTQMLWVVIVLIPKGSGGYRGIGLLDPLWKVVECLLDDRMNVIQFHDSLHGFVQKRGCNTAVLEAKLLQQLAYLRQTPLFGVFLDLKKAYDAMDRSRCIHILEGYGVGEQAMQLIRNFWDQASLACRAQGRYGPVFKAGRGVTQGGPLSPKLFNVMVDAVVREWLRIVLGDEYTMPEMEIDGVARLFTALFYADDGYIASSDEETLQRSVDVLTGLFDRVGLKTNVDKTKVMTCVDARIRVRQSEESYIRSRAGYVSERDWSRRRVECDKCGKELSAASLNGHLAEVHGVFRSRVLGREFVLEDDRDPVTFSAHRSANGRFFCPAPECQNSLDSFRTAWSLRVHFNRRHPRDSVDVEGSGVFPKCRLCNMQADPRLASVHEESNFCREGRERIAQANAAMANLRALDVGFTAYGEPLERVEVFKYLGRLLSMDDTDTQAIRTNLAKARKAWKMFHRLLRGQNMSPRVCGMFFKAVIQAVLLYGSESWVLTRSALRCLEGFVYQAACRMARQHRKRKDQRTGEYIYPAREDVYEEVGLYTVEEYINRRRQTVASYIRDRPIFDLCMEGERQRGTRPRKWWWDQEVDVDLESEEDSSSVVSEDH